MTQFFKPCLLSRITSHCTYFDDAVQRGTERLFSQAKQSLSAAFMATARDELECKHRGEAQSSQHKEESKQA